MPLSFHWRKSTAASPCSCQGIHHPTRDGEAQPQPWAEQGGLCSCAGSEGAGGDLGSETAAGRGARQGTGPAGPAVHAPLTRVPHSHGTEHVAGTQLTRRCVRRMGTRAESAAPPARALPLSFLARVRLLPRSSQSGREGITRTRASAGRGRTVSGAWGPGLGVRAWVLGSLGKHQPHGGSQRDSLRLPPLTASSSPGLLSSRGDDPYGWMLTRGAAPLLPPLLSLEVPQLLGSSISPPARGPASPAV